MEGEERGLQSDGAHNDTVQEQPGLHTVELSVKACWVVPEKYWFPEVTGCGPEPDLVRQRVEAVPELVSMETETKSLKELPRYSQATEEEEESELEVVGDYTAPPTLQCLTPSHPEQHQA